MKTMILIAFVASLSSTVFAQQKKPVDVSNELEAQVNVSRDQLKILTNQIGKSGNQTYVHSDYHAKMEKFAVLVNATMGAFDSYLANELLPVLQDDITNYNSVVKSKDYAADQKAQTLNATLQIIKKKAALITPNYKEQIMKLYRIFSDYPVGFDINGIFVIAHTIGGDRVAVRNSDKEPKITIFQEYVLPLLQDGCRSYSCITLTAVDYGVLLSGIKSKLDRNLVITLADGANVTVESINFKIDEALGYIKSNAYPDEVLTLPFDAK